MRTLRRLTKQEVELVAHYEKALQELHREKVRIAKNRRFYCEHCQKASFLKNAGFVQEFFYVPPSGCAGGDYHKEVAFELCHIVCHHCGNHNYIYNHKQKKELVSLFTECKLTKEEIFGTLYIRKRGSVMQVSKE